MSKNEYWIKGSGLDPARLLLVHELCLCLYVYIDIPNTFSFEKRVSRREGPKFQNPPLHSMELPCSCVVHACIYNIYIYKVSSQTHKTRSDSQNIFIQLTFPFFYSSGVLFFLNFTVGESK